MSAKVEAAYHPYPAGVRVYENLEQGSDEWLAHRCGIITASVIGQLITSKTIKPAQNDYSRALTTSLVAERITGRVEPIHVNDAMMRGNLDEPYARDAYATHTGAKVTEVGFMVREHNGARVGYSPDGLVNADGLIEIKSRAPKKQLATILEDQVPAENLAQIQTGLWVSGRDWCDYVSYAGGMPLYIRRVTPDFRWFEAIAQTVNQFEASVKQMIATYETRVKGLLLTERINHFATTEMSL